jgi:hypothetical protein
VTYLLHPQRDNINLTGKLVPEYLYSGIDTATAALIWTWRGRRRAPQRLHEANHPRARAVRHLLEFEYVPDWDKEAEG